MIPTFLRTALLCTLLPFTSWPAPLSAMDLPDIGGPESGVLSPARESAMRSGIIHQIRRTLPVLDDAEISAHVRAIGHRLLAADADARGDFFFLVLKDPGINAFAAPGGVIAVNTGLILASHDESELAGVLAHEIAHVTQRHLARSHARQGEMTIQTGLALLAGLVLGAYSPDAGAAATLSALAVSQQTALNYSRQNEQEADRIGIRVLAEAGYDPAGMPRFFATLLRETGQGSKLIEYLMTHPLNESRLSDTQARADRLRHGRQLETDHPSFHYLKARVRVLAGNAADRAAALSALAGKRRLTTLERYEYGLALTRSGKPHEAVTVLKGIRDTGSTLPVHLALAEALIAADQPAAAENLLNALRALYPTRHPVLRLLARTHIALGRYQDAIDLLFGYLAREDVDPEDYHLLATAAGRLGKRALAREAKAEYHFALGEYGEARRQIVLALDEEDADPLTRKRLERKRQQIEEWIKEHRE